MKNKVRGFFFTFIIFFFYITVGLAQSLDFNHNKPYWSGLSFDFQDNFRDSLASWPERVMLQIANEHINADEPLFFKAYLTTEKQPKRYSKSGVLNVELLDDNGTLLKRQFHKIVDGMVRGQLELPKNMKSGSYAVKAYTRWSQNYGPDFVAREKIKIGDLTNGKEITNAVFEVSIMPEGGTFLNDHENRVIIKFPLDQNLKMVQSGRILDENKQEVAHVSFYSSGLGTAIFKPMKDSTYQLELEDGTLFPIPMAETEGYLLHVNNLDENNAKIRITASANAPKSELRLIGMSGGITYFEKKLNFRDGRTLDVELSKANFPHGVFTLKLVDNLGSELADRPIWIDGARLHIDIEPVGSGTDANQKTYKIKVTDHTNTPIKSQLAVSVNRYHLETEKSLDENSVEQNSLYTFSEILDESKVSTYRKKTFLKDLDLLSSANEFGTLSKEEDMTNDIKFSFQKGLEIMGHAFDLNNTLLRNTTIQVVASNDKDVWIGEVETDDRGLLKLDDIQIEGEATLISRTKGDDVKSRLVKIVPIPMMKQKKKVLMPYVAENPKQVEEGKPTVVSEPFYIDKSEKIIELGEVEVEGKSVERKKYTPSLYGINLPPNRIKYQDFEKPKSLLQLLAELPGVIVSGVETLNPKASVLGAVGPILWVVDGFPLSQEGTGTQMGTSSQSALVEIMSLVSDRDVERIELLKGPEASIFGSRASGGVFIIYTRKGNELEYIRRKEGQLVFEGYTTALDFNEYKESLSRRKEEKINLLYWNPQLETDENGEATITIPLPSDNSGIKIEASTISLDGKIGMASIIN
ncbi:TonB-dependent receptor [Flagellimonas pelagia]|uniref:TonB-dependent receptor plug domain-containing protein n=1 Tax=Flagellimonas pelagia TaxID=2306998 RepID=A0A3A1NC57_9FLAO|nr:Plug domain-containing protein [Allomuricauda maritima]RIV41978.1 hypothetical protein D2V05_17890 [Allomuricauda maritima]TXJ90857.1 hypothetical protein FQ017_17730 [Allomuricauda maritima]